MWKVFISTKSAIIERIFVQNKEFYKTILRIGIPFVLQSLITIGVNMTDTIMLGHYGEIQISASSLSGEYINIFQILCFGIGGGAGVLTAQYWGAGDIPSLKSVVSIMLRIVLSIAVLFTVVTTFFPDNIIRLYAPNEPDVIEKGVLYLRMSAASFVLMGISLTLTFVLRSVRQVRVPLFATIAIFIANIFGNWIFIFGKLGFPEMQIQGAALSTLICRAIECAIIAGYFFFNDKKGIDVIITYKAEKEKADEVVTEIKGYGVQAAALRLDTTEIHSFDGFASELLGLLTRVFGKDTFDYLINNAGIGVTCPFLKITEQQFDDLINVHVKGIFFLTQKMSGLLADNGGIVNISTGLTRFTVPGASAYAAAKDAVEILTKYMAKELGVKGIRVNAIAPGPVDTDLGGGHASNQGFKDFVASQTTFGRIGLPDHIGTAVASLCSPYMAWVTAQRIEVSGGMML